MERSLENPIALRLSVAMQQAGLGATHLARQAGVPPSFILDILNGKSNHPSAIRLAKVASALQLPMTALIDEAVIEMDRFKVLPLKQTGDLPGLWFSPHWLRNLAGDDWALLRWYELEHGNRHPHLKAGTQLLIHSGWRLPSSQGWFALWHGQRIRVRALKAMPDGLWYPIGDEGEKERPLRSEDIAGRMLWMGHRCEERTPTL